MGLHNAIVILFDGDMPSDKAIAEIATIIGNVDSIRIHTMLSEELAANMATMLLQKINNECDATKNEELTQALVYICEKYDLRPQQTQHFAETIACDTMCACRMIGQFGCETDKVKQHIALINALKEIAKVRFADIPKEFKLKGLSISHYNFIKHLAKNIYVLN